MNALSDVILLVGSLAVVAVAAVVLVRSLRESVLRALTRAAKVLFEYLP